MKKFVFLAVITFFVLLHSLCYSATTWYMPEGSTQGRFELWILVTNPNSSTANITYTFYKGSGGTVTSTATIAANSRSTIKVNDISGLEEEAISTKVECTNGLNIYAERAMYWYDANNVEWAGGHTSRAVSGLEGCYTEISQPSSFPITISQSGSYKLIQNLTCSTEDVNAIEITATDVTLDLNGFSIVGPGYNAGTSGNGISISSNYNRVTITNGTIKNFRKRGIYTFSAFYYTFSNLKIHYNGDWGIYSLSSYNGIIDNCIFSYNGSGEVNASAGGLRIYMGNIVRNNNFYYNKGFGIYTAGNYNTIERNNVSTTQEQGAGVTEAGISIAGDYNRIEGNNCGNNNTYDIHLTAASSNDACIYNTSETAVQNDGGSNVVSIASSGNITF